MVVGPTGRTGRDQLAEVTRFIEQIAPSPSDVVLVGCAHSALSTLGRSADLQVFTVSCIGAMHTSVLEYLVRAGAGGVVVASCPPRDCWNREGVTWFEERVHHEREAELKERVDRNRIHIVYAAAWESGLLRRETERFRNRLGALDRSVREEAIHIDTTCEAPDVSVAERADA